jgi:uncharacterized protein (DUF433 family)
MNATTKYTYLAPRDGSGYQQFFFKGRNLRAETMYRATIGSEPMTPEEVAEDYDVPVASVLEAIKYAVENASLLQREREENWVESHARKLVELSP